uniref:LRAT domain-containing protein n=1 Tax=Cyprinus carpio TaxID=7962 RepID=A0A8C2BQU1_CYPCA
INQFSSPPIPGDLIEIFRGLYQHWAIYVGDGNVIHVVLPSENTDAGGSRVKSVLRNKAIVKKEKLQDVVSSDKYRINNVLDEKYQPLPDILQKAENLVGETLPYDLLTRNCEHFVTQLRYGTPQSQQVQLSGAKSCGFCCCMLLHFLHFTF